MGISSPDLNASIDKQKIQKNLDFYSIVTFKELVIFEDRCKCTYIKWEVKNIFCWHGPDWIRIRNIGMIYSVFCGRE
jgi:hypothetical protein